MMPALDFDHLRLRVSPVGGGDVSWRLFTLADGADGKPIASSVVPAADFAAELRSIADHLDRVAIEGVGA